jgi:hypothetical protein
MTTKDIIITISKPNSNRYDICADTWTVWGYDKDGALLDEIPQWVFQVRDTMQNAKNFNK